MNTEVIELRRKAAEALNLADALDKRVVAENRDFNEAEQAEYDGYMATVKRAKDAEGRFEQRVSQKVEVPMYNTKTRLGDSEERALAYYIRTNDESALREVRASNDTIMNVGTAADGGNAVPTGHFNSIIARRDEGMLAKQLGVRVIPGKGTTVNVPIDNEADGEFVATSEQVDGGTNTFDRDAPALDKVAMTLVRYTKKIPLTDELLNDEDSALLAFISDFVGRGMAKTHNSLLMTAALAGGTAAVTFDNATSITAPEIPELYYKLADEYSDGNVAWVMQRATEGAIRGLQGNAFLFGAGGPNDLWGAPVYNSAYAGSVTGGGKSLVLGNWSYVGMREAPSITFLRDPYTVEGAVVLKYYFRTVYKVLQSEAIVYGTHPTA